MKNMKKIIAKIVIISLVLLNAPLSVYAAEDDVEPSLQIIHSPLDEVAAGELINVAAEVESMEGIELVRIYFRSMGSEFFYFVPMILADNSEYTGLLPSPNGYAESIEYLFLVKTYNNRIFTSQSFTATVSGQVKQGSEADQTSVDVSIETLEVPTTLAGFNEKTRVRTVTIPEKHGVAAGLYEPEDTGGTTSNGQYHGTVVATEKSYLNAILIGGGVVAGAAIVVALVGSSGSGGGGGSSSTDTTDSDTTTATGVGSWTLNFIDGSCTKTTSQTVACSDGGLVTSVAPTTVSVPVADSCEESSYGGLANIFSVGGSCDTVTACNSYSSADLAAKVCNDSSMVITKDGGSRVETWTR